MRVAAVSAVCAAAVVAPADGAVVAPAAVGAAVVGVLCAAAVGAAAVAADAAPSAPPPSFLKGVDRSSAAPRTFLTIFSSTALGKKKFSQPSSPTPSSLRHGQLSLSLRYGMFLAAFFLFMPFLTASRALLRSSSAYFCL